MMLLIVRRRGASASARGCFRQQAPRGRVHFAWSWLFPPAPQAPSSALVRSVIARGRRTLREVEVTTRLPRLWIDEEEEDEEERGPGGASAAAPARLGSLARASGGRR